MNVCGARVAARSWGARILIFLALFGGMGARPQAQSQSSEMIYGHTRGIKVALVPTMVADARGTPGFRMTVTTRAGSKALFLPSIIEQPQSIELVTPTRAALIGNISGVVQAVTIFNPVTARIELQFPCEFPTLSPDNTKLAFIRFFTPHFAPLGTSSFVYMVMDLAAPIERPGPAMRMRAGLRVYPQADPPAKAMTDRDVHRLGGHITWVSDRQFTFIDVYRGRQTAVVVTASQSGWTASSPGQTNRS